MLKLVLVVKCYRQDESRSEPEGTLRVNKCTREHTHASPPPLPSPPRKEQGRSTACKVGSQLRRPEFLAS
eukprot:1150639-Pelagomonas_calceolata.AAC.1